MFFCFGLSVSLHVKRWKYFLHTWLTASLSESETSPKGCHPGESHFSQKSAARRESTAHRCSQLKHGLRALPLDYLSQISLHLSALSPENTKLVDVYLFLFDEFLLITKIKRNKKVRRSVPSEQNWLGLHVYLYTRVMWFSHWVLFPV